MGDSARAKCAEMWELLCRFPWGKLGPHLTQCLLGGGLPPYQLACWSIEPFGCSTPTLQTGQRSRSIARTVSCNGHPKSLVSVRMRAHYIDKSNGDRVETENSFTLSIWAGGSYFRSRKTTSGLTETTNTAVWTRRSTIRKPLKILQEVVFWSLFDVP